MKLILPEINEETEKSESKTKSKLIDTEQNETFKNEPTKDEKKLDKDKEIDKFTEDLIDDKRTFADIDHLYKNNFENWKNDLVKK